MLIAATNIGGLVAVFRSAQTRTETSAALREVSDLRIAVLSAPLLRRDREPFGALCFTWEARVVPTQGAQASEMIDILQRWAQAFGVALSRIYRLHEELER